MNRLISHTKNLLKYEKDQWINDALIFKLTLKYATFISVFLQLLYYLDIIPFSYAILGQITFVFVGGIYITYIQPKYFNIPELNMQIKEKEAVIVDFIIHQLPLYIFLFIHFSKIKIYRGLDINNIIFISILSSLYFLTNNPFKLYNINRCDILNISSITLILFFILNKILLN